MLLTRITKRNHSLEVFVGLVLCTFLCAQMGCIEPPTITVDSPQAGLTHKDEATVSLSFAEGSASVDVDSFSALNGSTDITSLLTVTASGANGVVPLGHGSNAFLFSVRGSDGAQGEARTVRYKTFPFEPASLSGIITPMTSVQFDTVIHEEKVVGTTLPCFEETYGIDPNAFAQASKEEILDQATGDTTVVFRAALRTSANLAASEAADSLRNPENETVTFHKLTVPLSITRGQMIRHFTWLVIENHREQYVIIDDGYESVIRMDYTDPDNPDTYAYQVNGEPVDLEMLAAMVASGALELSNSCAWGIAVGMIAIAGGTAFFFGSAMSGAAISGWLFANGMSAIGMGMSCSCGSMATYPWCS